MATNELIQPKVDMNDAKGKATPPVKKPYRKPVLYAYGDVRDLTLGTSVWPGESPGYRGRSPN